MVQSQTSIDIYVLVFGGALALSLLVAGIVGFLLFYQKRLADQALMLKEMELNYQQDVVYRTLDAVEDERKRVARDLHDEVGAALSAMRLLVGQLAHKSQNNTETDDLTIRFKVVIDNTIDSVRRISNDLLPQGLEELGLTYALEGLCESAMDIADVNVELTVEHEITLPTRTNLIVYRLVQELLNNALKHADASDIRLQLRQRDNRLELLYADDGKGFDYAQAYQQRSLGLKNIETRAQMLNGTVSFETQPGQGLRVTASIPLTTNL
ncbi:sensor histidine kinase [Spirosoma endbachense]|uniref:histidine kinase n=1 Tax=Spirosoma endbachense TaxID=2666025 RepID=A0A6P1W450_9BACT|nr:sensor histidine kinase [Spirosoma endbachense]QHW00194.1 sensor histidine kinase [Spirosoma endbachense]